MKINIDPQEELLRWGPIDGKLFYTDFFNVAFAKYPKIFYSWPDVLWIGFKEKIIAIVPFVKLRKSGRKNFRKFILHDSNFKKYYKLWDENLKDFLAFSKDISSDKLRKLTDSQLASFYKKWSELYLIFWLFGLLPEVAGWGGEDILKKDLEKVVPAKDFTFVFEKLSAPADLSFYQKADLELLKLKPLTKNKKLFERRLSEYQKNYFWILNSYHHTRVLTKNYFKKQLLSYSATKAEKKVQELKSLPAKAVQEKKRIIKKYKLSKNIAKISSRLGYSIWWQDLRKYYIFLANHQIDLFLREFSKRFSIDFNDLHYYNISEMSSLVAQNKKIPTSEIRQRYRNLLVYYSEKNNSLKYVSGKVAKKIYDQFMDVKLEGDTRELKGVVVSQGAKIKGKVRILLSIKDFNKMRKGEVLVTAMTSPDYITAIKKASAIVTDEGGMTCHAAIVSRELGIPCIVSTKVASKVLKDGDAVEVDTVKGIVKRINK